ncbi:hypothetical protein Acr_15g0008150 [Actinidia rufa]|uniref:Retrotransposon gag domain-containing protein n=1 Tax=Actinidia rufa TaxID=165716 RepID=A0A7J0FUT8_9ERIC|nr:hypothetical protein Acr_15g0008150 [Actinidia rufa]
MCIPYGVLIAILLAFTLGMEDEVEIVRYLDCNPLAGERKSQPAKKLTSEEDCLAQIDAIDTGVKAPIIVDALIRQTELPFTERLMRVKVSSKFKLPPQLGIYAGKKDLMDHLDLFKNLMLLQGALDEVICRVFSVRGPAKSWFRKLSPRTIDSFDDLSKHFVANFLSYRVRQKNAAHLFTIHQKTGESLKEYVRIGRGQVKQVKKGRGLQKEKASFKEDRLQGGYLRKFVVDRLRSATLERAYIDNKPTTGDIQIIHGGFKLGDVLHIQGRDLFGKQMGKQMKKFIISPCL